MMEAAQSYRRFLETLSPASLQRLPEFVHHDVHFRDPFNDVRGADAMAQVFRHMFDNVPGVAFSVQHLAIDANVCLMSWRFTGTLFGQRWAFDGTSVVLFNNDGHVTSHTDYWDAARTFYERLPVIGWLLAAIRRRIAVR